MSLPHVVIYNAVSLDGRTTGFPVDLGQFYGLASHWKEDATLVGSETILAAEGVPPDDENSAVPQVDPADTRALLAIVDSRGRVKTWNWLRNQPYWRDAVAICSRSTPKAYLDHLRDKNVDRIIAGDDRADLRAALEELGHRYGVKRVRVDSGGVLNGALLRAGLVDEVSVLIHPTLVGGMAPSSIFRMAEQTSSAGAVSLKLTHLERLDGDLVWLIYQTVK